MRKVLELLVGGIIFTGQERPVGTRQDIREDLWKKFTSGDKLSGRMPYGILTKMLEISGWKRTYMGR